MSQLAAILHQPNRLIARTPASHHAMAKEEERT
jgi:hypothetical protein